MQLLNLDRMSHRKRPVVHLLASHTTLIWDRAARV
jgi:hypothetical protein